MALRTLATFNLDSHNLLPFVTGVLLDYCNDECAATRKQAVFTCSALLRKHLVGSHVHGAPTSTALHNTTTRGFFGADTSPLVAATPSPAVCTVQAANGLTPPALALGPAAVIPGSSAVECEEEEHDRILTEAMARLSWSEKTAISEALARLLALGISDPVASVRVAVVSSLWSDFDAFLAQAGKLHALSIALNDEHFAVREGAVLVMGRLSRRNPAHAKLSLRKALMQLLTELQFGVNARARQESAKLLAERTPEKHCD